MGTESSIITQPACLGSSPCARCIPLTGFPPSAPHLSFLELLTTSDCACLTLEPQSPQSRGAVSRAQQTWCGAASQPSAPPLCWRPIHDDVDPQDLHGVEGVGQVAHGGQSDEAQSRDAPAGHKWQTEGTVNSCLPEAALGAVRDSGLDLRAQLKSDKVFDVVKNPLAFLHCIPTREKKAFIHEEGLAGSAGSTSC